jgi:hypothetical protein
MFAMAQKGAGTAGAGHGNQMTQAQQNPSSMQQNQNLQQRQNTATTSPTPAHSATPNEKSNNNHTKQPRRNSGLFFAQVSWLNQ